MDKTKTMQDLSKEMRAYRSVKHAGLTFYTNRRTGDAVMKAIMKHCKADQVVIAFKPNNANFRWFAVCTAKQLLKRLKEDHQLYEIMMECRVIKVGFDIDIKTQNKPDKNVLTKIKEKILEFFPGARLNICGSEVEKDGLYHYSYHIVLENYVFGTEEELKALRDFARAHQNELGFDPRIYKADGQLKYINQSKGDGRIQSFIEGSENLMDHTLLHNIPEDAKAVSSLRLTLQLEEREAKAGQSGKGRCDFLADIPIRGLDVPDGFDLYSHGPLSKLMHIPNAKRHSPQALNGDISFRIRRWCKASKLTFEEYWKWAQTKDDSSGRHQGHLQSWNTLDLETFPASEHTVDLILMIIYKPDILKTAHARRMIAKYNDHFDRKIKSMWLTADDLESTEKHVVLHVGLGGNKTGSVIDYMVRYKEANPNKSMLFITCRVALGNDQKQRLRKAGIEMELYMNVNKSERKNVHSKYFLCSIQSLYLAQGHYDLVVVDECETTLASFAGGGTTHRKYILMNWFCFLTHIQGAEKVIWMDGLLTTTTLNLINNADPKATRTIIGREPQIPARSIHFCKSIGTLYHELFRALDSGKKVFIGVSHKGRDKDKVGSVEHIVSTLCKKYEWQRGVEIIGYHAQAVKDKQRLELGVDNMWKNDKKRCIVTNATLAVGINCSLKDVFDQVFMIWEPFVMSHRDFLQLAYRVRHPKNSRMIVYKGRMGGSASPDDNTLERPDDRIWSELQKDLKIELVADKNAAGDALFQHYCNKMNITIEKTRLECSEEELKFVAKMYDNSQVCFAWNNIKAIDKDEMEENERLIKLGEGGMDIRLQAQKYYFTKVFARDTPEDLIRHWWEYSPSLAWACHNLGMVAKHRKTPDLPDSKDWLDLHSASKVVYDLLQDNHLQVGDEFPAEIVCSTSREDIKKAFHWAQEPKTYRHDLFSKMLNGYFGHRIYYKDYEKSNKKQRYGYSTSSTYTESVKKDLLPHLVVFREDVEWHLELDT